MESVSQSGWMRSLHSRLTALVLVMVVLVPLVAAPTDSRAHGLAALAFEGFALLLLVTLLWSTSWKLRKEQVASFLRTGANLPALLLLGLATLSCALSPQKAYSIQETLRLGAGVLLYFVVASQFRRSESLNKLTGALLAVAIGAAFLGFAQFGATNKEFAIGLFGDHQLFGSFLMLLLPLCAVMAITEKIPNRQLAAQVATVLMATCLLMAHARSAWIGAASGLATLGLLGLYIAYRNRKTENVSWTMGAKKHEVVLPIMLLVVAAGFFLIVSPQATPILNRVSTLSNVGQDSTWQTRQSTWQAASRMIGEHPLRGVGIGLYPFYQQQYTHAGYPVATLGGRPSLGEQAHNLYLQTLAELGLPGLLLLGSVLLSFWIAGFRRLGEMKSDLRRNLLMGTLASTVAFAVDAFASPSWQLPQLSMFFWLLLGLGVGCLRPHRSRSDIEIETRQTFVPSRWQRTAFALPSLLLASLLPTVVYAACDNYKIPVSASLTPEEATIHAGQSQTYKLVVTFSDNSTADVTTCNASISKTKFYQVFGAGSFTGSNGQTYKSVPQDAGHIVIIAGVYQQTATGPGTHAGIVADVEDLNVTH